MAENEKDSKVEASEDKKVEEAETKDSKHEEKEKSYFEETVKSTFDTITDNLQVIAESQKSLLDSVQSIEGRVKALEEPTNLEATPKGTADKEDVGAETKAPEKPYPQGEQSGLDDDGDDTSNDDSKLSGQEKPIGKATQIVEKAEHTFTTETPRPNSLENVDKAEFGKDFSPILKDARSNGFEGLSEVAQNILNGKYYKPTQDEVGQW